MEMETDAKDSLCSYLPKECSTRRMRRNKTNLFESTVNKHEGHRGMQISKNAFGNMYCDGFAQGIAQQWSRGTPAGDVRQQ
jgi:hypothetical protein